MAMEEREKEEENADSGVIAEDAPPEANGMDEDVDAKVLPVKAPKKKPGRKSRVAVADDDAMQVDEPATKKKKGRKPRVASVDAQTAMEVDAVESSTNGKAKPATKKGKRKAAPSSPAAAESDGEPEVDTPEDDGRPVRKKQKVSKLLDQ